MTSALNLVVNSEPRDFPGDPVVKTLPFNAGGVGSTPGWRPKIPHALGPKKKKNRNNKGFKNGPHQKKKRNLRKNSETSELHWVPTLCLELRRGERRG